MGIISWPHENGFDIWYIILFVLYYSMAEKSHSSQGECIICRKKFPVRGMMAGDMLQAAVFEITQKRYPEFSNSSLICKDCLNIMRSEYVVDTLKEEDEKFTELEREVAQSLRDQETLSEDTYEEYERTLTFGERIADKVAEFGGSWTFVSLFFIFIAFWMGVNSYILLTRSFDPYPYILLNLVLSCLAAIQAPIIMMSQNRQEERDRLRSQHDYQVNLKAELEIRHLHEKMDMIVKNQWRRLMEIQKMQIDILEEMRRR
jgi:uncharacterized membrane protein